MLLKKDLQILVEKCADLPFMTDKQGQLPLHVAFEGSNASWVPLASIP